MAKKPMTKSEILGAIAQDSGLQRKQVSGVLDALAKYMRKGLKEAGVFTLPGLIKIERKQIPARPARKGVPNPFKPGELMDVAAKPASSKVKVRPLKALKAMI